jgi:hypothetical protein
MNPKRTLPLLLILLASCQLHEGPTFAEGLMRSSVAIEVGSEEDDADYGAGTTAKTEVDTFSVDLMQGYFLNQNLEVGGSFLLSTKDQKITSKDSGTTSSTGVEEKRFALSGFARYYFVPSGSTRFFAEGRLGWVDGTRDFDFAGATANDFDGFLFGLAAGASTFLSESSAIETQVAYRSATLDGSDNFGNSFDIDSTELAFLIGYSVYF